MLPVRRCSSCVCFQRNSSLIFRRGGRWLRKELREFSASIYAYYFWRTMVGNRFHLGALAFLLYQLVLLTTCLGLSDPSLPSWPPNYSTVFFTVIPKMQSSNYSVWASYKAQQYRVDIATHDPEGVLLENVTLIENCLRGAKVQYRIDHMALTCQAFQNNCSVPQDRFRFRFQHAQITYAGTKNVHGTSSYEWTWQSGVNQTVLYYDSQSGRFPILSNESWPLGGSIVTTYIAFRSEDPDAHHFQPGRLCSTGTATPTAVSIPPPKPPAPSSVLSPHPSPRNGHWWQNV